MLYRDGFIGDDAFGLDKLAFSPFYTISVTTGVDLTATGTTDLYTIPSGETPVILGAIFEVTTANTVTVDAQVSIGIAAGETDIIPTTPLVDLDTLDDTYTLWVTAKSVHGTASDVIRLNVQTAATATALVATVRLIALQT